MKVNVTITRLKKAGMKVFTNLRRSLYTHGILSVDGLCLPDFLGIGAQKAGTSWLHRNLKSHPEIFLPAQKELHFFDISFRYTTLRKYASNFKLGGQLVKGEFTPAYSFIPVERIQFIQTVMPNVKLIFMMRNPVDRAWSQALMNLVFMPNRKFIEVGEDEFFAHFTALRSVTRGDYQSILSNWLSVFPPEQLYINFFEEIENNPKRLLSEIFEHIGVSKNVGWDAFPYNQIINKGPDISMPVKYRKFLQDMYYQDIEILYERFGQPVAPWRISQTDEE